MLSGLVLMRYASCMEFGFFDSSAVFDDVVTAPEEHISRCEVWRLNRLFRYVLSRLIGGLAFIAE
jgi:hypothetical protein